MANVIDRLSHASYIRSLVISEVHSKKERSNETHLSAKRIGTQTSPWIPLSDVNRWRSPGFAGTSCKGSCAPFCLDAEMPVEGYLNGV